MRCGAASVVALMLLIGLGIGGAGADEVSAKFYTARGAKLLASGDRTEAREQYEKALEEKAGYAPALLGLAQMEANGDEPDQAIVWLDACLEQEARSGLSKDEKGAISKARKLYRKLDRPRLELRDILRSFQSKLLDMAIRYEQKDPALARRCLERLLKVCPDHPEALRLLKGAATNAAAPLDALGGKRKELFNGKNFDGWNVDSPIWKVANGCIKANPGADGHTLPCHEMLGESYTLEIELCAPDGIPQGQLIGVLFGDGGASSYAFALLPTGVALIRNTGAGLQIIKRVPFTRIADGFTPTEWHTLRMEIRGKDFKATIDGMEALTFKAEFNDAFSGTTGLWAQRTPLQVRRVSLVN